MPENVMQPTDASVSDFLSGVDEKKRQDSQIIMTMMEQISGQRPVMWGPSIVGFGSQHYKYDTGREGDMPLLGFSPRKANMTIYFNEGFDDYGDLLEQLGKHKISRACLYINKLSDVDHETLEQLLGRSYKASTTSSTKPVSVADYIANIPAATRPKFDELRQLVKQTLPQAEEVLSYGIVGYKVDDKRARVFISGWKDHLALYPIPKDEKLVDELKPYIKGKGTLWFGLDQPLPVAVIEKTIKALAEV